MRSTELFRSCANEHVAAAAMACIGGALEKRVAIAARRTGLTPGAYIVRLVAEYDRKASPTRRNILERGMFRQDMPILAGLRHVVELGLEDASDAEASHGEDGDLADKAEAYLRDARAAFMRIGTTPKSLYT
jgi:hypothetical protein